MPAGVCVARATARPAPAEGGGGLGEWVTSRGRRQAVWAAEPMNQLSGERGAGGGRRNAPEPRGPGGQEGGASAPPRGSPGGLRVPGEAGLMFLALRTGGGPLAFSRAPHGRALCREARELGRVP